MVGQPLARRAFLGVLAAGAIAVSGVGGFLYLEDRIGPGRLTARALVDRLEELGGRFPGYRRAHAKGLGVAGHFESNGAGSAVSTASVFQKGSYDLLGRFSLAGGSGDPHADDAQAPGRGIALKFALPGGEQWRAVLVTAVVFAVATPEAVYESGLASRPDPVTGKPDPAKMKAFLEAHPEAVRAQEINKAAPPVSGFTSSTYAGLHAFWCQNAAGARTPVRWKLVPEQPVSQQSAAERPGPDAGRDALFQELAKQIRAGQARLKLVLTLGLPGVDPTHDPSSLWPADRREIEVGTVVLTEVGTTRTAKAQETNFDPNVLPAGIEASDDPVLAARGAIYSESYRRRSHEGPGPEVTV